MSDVPPPQLEPRPPEPGGQVKRRSLLPPKGYKKTIASTTADLPSTSASALQKTSSTPVNIPSAQPIVVGDNVTIAGVKQGVVRYVGPLHFAEGTWFGIQLDDGDGKNDGSAEGTRYFTCPPGHGIFAPRNKIGQSTHSTRTPSPDKVSRLPQLKSRVRSQSPEVLTAKKSKSDESKESSEPEESAKDTTKPKSRLARPKLLPPRHLRDEISSTGSSAPSSRESSASPHRDVDSDGAGRDSSERGREGGAAIKPASKLPCSQDSSKLPKRSGIPAPKIPNRALPKPVVKSVKEKDLNETYIVEDNYEDDDLDKAFVIEEEEDIPEVTSPSRVDAKTALTLAYDLETENSDLDKQKLNLTFEVRKEKTESAKQSPASNTSNVSSVHSPIPDLLTSSVYSSTKGSPVDYPGDCMSESEDNVDFLANTNSPDSVGSLGILNEQDLCDNSLLGDDLKAALGVSKKDEKSGSSSSHVDVKEVNKNWVDREFDEKDLDHEISGISTPEIDISSRSSTVSDKVVPSSPEPDGSGSALKRSGISDDFHLSDSSSPTASPSHVRRKHSSLSESESAEESAGLNATYAVTSPLTQADDVGTLGSHNRKFITSKSLPADNTHPIKEEATGGKEDDTIEENYPMNASFELTRTAVTQYASLLEAAEKERVNRTPPKTDKRSSYHEDMLKRDSRSRSSSQEKTLKRYSTGSDFSHIDFEHSKLRRLDLSGSKSKKMSETEENIQFEVDEEAEDEEETSIIEELVSRKKERPTSTISSCSNDTGIQEDQHGILEENEDVLDDILDNASNLELQRPVSMISTTSTDTGIMSDFVDQCNGNGSKRQSGSYEVKKRVEGGKRNSQVGGGGENQERPESLYSEAGVDTDGDDCQHEEEKEQEEDDEKDDAVRSWIRTTEHEDVTMVTAQQQQVPPSPSSSSPEDLSTPLQEDPTAKQVDVMTQQHQSHEEEDVMSKDKIIIEPDQPSQQSFPSLSSDSLDTLDRLDRRMDQLDSPTVERKDIVDVDDSDLVTPVVEQPYHLDSALEKDDFAVEEELLPNVSNLLQSQSQSQKFPSPDLLMDGVHEKIANDGIHENTTRDSIHEAEEGVHKESQEEKSQEKAMKVLVKMCDEITVAEDKQNYNALHSKYVDHDSVPQELIIHEELTLKTSAPMSSTPILKKSKAHGKVNDIIKDPQGISPMLPNEITTYPLGVILNPNPLNPSPLNQDLSPPDNAGKTPSPVEIHGLPKPMDHVDELNNAPEEDFPNLRSPPLLNQISMDVEGNIGVEFVCHTETNGEEESMDVDPQEFELPIPYRDGNSAAESIMTMSIHSLTGRFIEVVSVPPQCEELPLPPSPDPLQDIVSELEEEEEKEKEEEKEETPRKKARPSTPSKKDKKRPESAKDRLAESRRKASPAQRRSSAKEEDIKTVKAEVQRKKSLANVQSRVGDTFRKGVPKTKEEVNGGSTSSTSSAIKRTSVTSLQRKPVGSTNSTTIRKPIAPKVDALKSVRNRSADGKSPKSSQDELNGSSESVDSKKPVKRTPQQRKYSNITSSIDSGKTSKVKEVKNSTTAKTPTSKPAVKVTPSTASPRTSSSSLQAGSKPTMARKSLAPKPMSSVTSTPPSSPTPSKVSSAASSTTTTRRPVGSSLTKPSIAASRRVSAPAPIANPSKLTNGTLARKSSLSVTTRGSGVSPRASLFSEAGSAGSKKGPGVGMANGVSPRSTSTSTSRTRKPPIDSTATRPPNRTTAAIKKQRSDSVGSDSQSSVVSEAASESSTILSHASSSSFTSQGSRSRSKPAEVKGQDEVDAGVNKRAPLKRRSLADIAATRQKNLAASRRASVAVSPATPGVKSPRTGLGPAKKPPNAGPRGKPTTATTTAASSSSPSTSSSKTSATSTMKRPHQPDLVPSGGAAPGAIAEAEAEIARLEVLCEKRTKEVTAAAREIKHSSAGFKAMSALVNYLTEQCDAFSCPEVKAKLSVTEKELNKSKQYLKDLTNQRDALIEEIQCLKQQQRTDAERWQAESRKREAAIEERMLKERREEVEKVTESHRRGMAAMKETQRSEVKELRQRHEETMAKLTEASAQQKRQLQQQHESNEKELHQKHEIQLQEITIRFDEIKKALSEKLYSLREECEEMRRREASFEAACRRDAELQVQVALTPYKHLPQEVESLKTVLELRNEEIHKLRQNNAELHHRLEALPVAKDKIARLEQKLENLEAILNIKGDYEKQLAEKHQQLLRKFDRENKMNKRLSMDNEELAWRLSMGETGLSPSASEASTPEPHRRSGSRSSMLKSPLPGAAIPSASARDSPRSPRSPRTGGPCYDFDNVVMRSPRSPAGTASMTQSMTTSQRQMASSPLLMQEKGIHVDSKRIQEEPLYVGGKLKRSGTYDLLDQVGNESDSANGNDEDDMKESDI